MKDVSCVKNVRHSRLYRGLKAVSSIFNITLRGISGYSRFGYPLGTLEAIPDGRELLVIVSAKIYVPVMAEECTYVGGSSQKVPAPAVQEGNLQHSLEFFHFVRQKEMSGGLREKITITRKLP